MREEERQAYLTIIKLIKECTSILKDIVKFLKAYDKVKKSKDI